MEQDEQSQDNQKSAEAAYRSRMEEYQKRQQQESQIRSMLQKIVEPAAFERLQNIKLTNSELYLKVAQLLMMLYQEGRLKKKVDEQMLKQLLAKLASQKYEPTIRFSRK